MVALLVAAPSVGFASSRLTSQEYVDSKIHETGTLSSSSTTTAPSEKMVYDAIAAIDGDVYTGTGLIDVTNHVISTTAQANVIETVKINNNALTPDVNKAVNIPLMVGATAGAAGTVGLVPASSAGDQDKFLKADGTWAVATASVMTGANGTNAGTSGLVPAPTATDNTKFLKGDGTWAEVDALPVGSAANQMLQYNSTNSTWDVVSIDTTPTSGHTVPVTSGGVYDVVNNKQTKPSSGVANGKVLTYTGSDVDTQVSAAYVTLPVATGAPSTNTPTAFAEVWIQQNKLEI